MFGVLLKKQLNEKLSYFKRGTKNMDIAGFVLTLALVAIILFVVVEVFSLFVEKYCAVRIDGLLDVAARERELITYIYETIIIIGAISSIGSINHALFEADDKIVMQTLPIRTVTIFTSKLFWVYLQQVIFSLILTIPLIAVFASTTNQQAEFIIYSLLVALFLPLFSIGIASVFCLPYFYIKKFLQSRYIFMLLIVTAVIGVCCYFYASILDFIENLMSTGEIKFFFSGETMATIINVANNLAPASFIALAVTGVNPVQNIFIALAILLGINLIGVFIVYMLYSRAMKASMNANTKLLFAPKHIHKSYPQNITLLIKEFELIFFTPDYSMQYLSVALVMPLMVFFCMGLGTNMISSLVLVEKNFELALALVLVFSALTNTFAATNISRDGKAFYVQKTMPLRYTKIIGAKVSMSMIISVISIAISSIIVVACKFVSPGEGAFIFFIGCIMALSQVLIATRKDLNHPHFPQDEDNIVKESNDNVSIVITLGLVLSLALCGIPLALSIVNALRNIDYTWFTYTFISIGALVILACSSMYMFIGLRKRFNELTEGA